MRTLLFPKVEKDFVAARVRNQSTAMWDGPALAAAQMQRLQEIWTDCTTDIPYYAKLVSSGQAPKQIRDWQDLRAIPVLTRQQLQDEPNSFRRYSGPPDDYIKTAGSDGTPLRLGVYKGERDLMRVVKLAAWQQFGYTLNSSLVPDLGTLPLVRHWVEGEIQPP